MAQSADAYAVWYWWKKAVALRVITEDGVFTNGQVPDHYAKGELHVDVIQRIIFVTDGGDISELNMDHRDTTMNKSKVFGVGATLNWNIQGCPVYTLAAPYVGAPMETWKVYDNPALTADMIGRATQMYRKMLQDRGLLVTT